MALKHVNAIVVGAGAGGGVVAKQLACAGLTVALLERGKWYSSFDCRKDDLRNQRISFLGCGFGPDNERYRRVVVDENGHEQIVKPTSWSYNNNAACVGSGTLSYGAMAAIGNTPAGRCSPFPIPRCVVSRDTAPKRSVQPRAQTN